MNSRKTSLGIDLLTGMKQILASMRNCNFEQVRRPARRPAGSPDSPQVGKSQTFSCLYALSALIQTLNGLKPSVSSTQDRDSKPCDDSQAAIVCCSSPNSVSKKRMDSGRIEIPGANVNVDNVANVLNSTELISQETLDEDAKSSIPHFAGVEFCANEVCEFIHDDGSELPAVAVKRGPTTPTPEMVEAHEAAGHIPYRSWCRACVAGRGRSDPHFAAKNDDGSLVVSDVHVVGFDYGYMTKSGLPSEEEKASPI